MDRALHRAQDMRRRIAIGVAALAVIGAAAAAATRDRGESRLLFTGDILLSRQVQAEMDGSGTDPWHNLAGLLRSADWVAGNLEGAFGDSAECVADESPLCFATRPEEVDRLARAGFSALTIANNHAADLGAAGIARTRAMLASRAMLGLDFDHSPQFIRVGEQTIALIAVNTIPGADGQRQQVPSIELAQKLRLAHTLAGIVIVSVHWGLELYDWPSPDQRAMARWLVEHGADVIMGHHPHVVQDPECIGRRPVFFSLGNHVFDQKYPATKVGLIADCRLASGTLRCQGIRTRSAPGTAVPVADTGAVFTALRSCGVAARREASLGATTLRPAAWTPDDTSGALVLEGWRDGARRWAMKRTNVRSLETGITSADGEPLLLSLEMHASDIDRETSLRPYVYGVGPRGLEARWRGSALAWPLLDATVERQGTICALHRGDSFIELDPTAASTRSMRYRWNGFGFSGAGDPGCRDAVR